jgi:hypothetical protein
MSKPGGNGAAGIIRNPVQYFVRHRSANRFRGAGAQDSQTFHPYLPLLSGLSYAGRGPTSR